jgi:transcriptional pleiotropic repressor
MSGADTIGSATIKRADLPFNDLELQAFYFFISVISLLVKFIDEKNMGNTERVKAAIGALSYSELVAALHVIEKINGQSGNFVSSHISAEKNISKSAIVNSLKKLESAGLIEVRSLGVKGTFVHFLNEALAVELKKLKH